MATTVHERVPALDRFRQLQAVNLLMIHLATVQSGVAQPPLAGLLDEDVLDLIGLDEWTELYASDPDDPNKEPSTTELARSDLLLAQLFSRLANASAYCTEQADYFHELAKSRLEELADDGR